MTHFSWYISFFDLIILKAVRETTDILIKNINLRLHVIFIVLEWYS